MRLSRRILASFLFVLAGCGEEFVPIECVTDDGCPGTDVCSDERLCVPGPVIPEPQDDTFDLEEALEERTLDVLANDNPSTLTITATTGPGRLGTIAFEKEYLRIVPGCRAGTETVTYTVETPEGLTATAEAAIEVTDLRPPGRIEDLRCAAAEQDQVRLVFTAPEENTVEVRGSGLDCRVSVYRLQTVGLTDQVVLASDDNATPGEEVEILVDASWDRRFEVTLLSEDEQDNQSPPSEPFQLEMRPRLEASPAESAFDFGAVDVGSSAEQTWSLVNQSCRVVTIRSPQLSIQQGSGLSLRTTPEVPDMGLELLPGESVELTVDFAPVDGASARATWSVVVQDGPDLEVRVSGTGRTSVGAADLSWRVEEEVAGLQRTLTATSNPPGSDLTWSAVGPIPPRVQLEANAGVLQLRPDSGCEAGRQTFSVRARDSFGAEDLAEVTLEVVDPEPPNAIAAIAEISAPSFNRAALRFEAPYDNPQRAGCRVSSYQVSVADNPSMTAATTTRVTAVPNAEGIAAVGFVADWNDEYWVQLRGIDDAGGTSMPLAQPVRIDLRYSSEIAPTSSSFGTVNETSPESQDFVLSVPSTALVPLELRSASIVGDPQVSITAGAPSSPLTLRPGESHRITVRFAPTQTQSIQMGTVLRVVTNHQTYDVPLTGQGQRAVTAVDDAIALDEETSQTVDVLGNDQANGSLGLGSTVVWGGSGAPGRGESATVQGNRLRYTAGCEPSSGLEYTAELVVQGRRFTDTARLVPAVRDPGPPGSIGAVVATPAGTSGQVELQFTAPGENGAGSTCPVSEYRLRTATNRQMTGATTTTWTNPRNPGASERRTVNLAIGSIYYLRLAGWDGTQLGPEASLTVDMRRRSSLVTSTTHDFGGVRLGLTGRHTVSVRNTSQIASINIGAAALSGPGRSSFRLDPAFPSGGIDLNPGETGNLDLVFEPTALNRSTATLSITTNAGNYTVSLSGEGLPPVVLVDDSYTVEEEGTHSLAVLDNDESVGTLTISQVSTPNNGGTASAAAGLGAVDYDSRACTPKSEQFTYVATNGTTYVAPPATVSVSVADTLAPAPITAVTLEASSLNRVGLGFDAPGENGSPSSCLPTQYEVLRSTAATMANPVTLTVNPSASQVGGAEVLDATGFTWGQRHYAQVVAVDEGGRRSTVQSPAIEVDLRRSATLDPAGSSVTIGPVARRSSVTQNFIVTNTSSLVDLSVGPVTLSGDPELTLTGPTSFSLAPGASGTIQVRYSPQVSGPDVSTLTIPNNSQTGTFSVSLTGETIPNRNPVTIDAFASPRILSASTSTSAMFTVEVRDLDSNLPGYNDVQSVTVDLSAVGGSTSVAMTAGTQTSSTARLYTAGPVSMTGRPRGAYVFPVHIVDREGAEYWDAVTLATYTGTARRVGAGQTYSTIQSAINAAQTGDAVILVEPTYTGLGNVGLQFPNNLNIVLGSNRGPSGTKIDCGGGTGSRAFNLFRTGQTADTVLTGLRIENCTGGAIRLNQVAPRLLDLEFQGNSGSPNSADIAHDSSQPAPRGDRLRFLRGGTRSQSRVSSIDCHYCFVDTPGSSQYFRFLEATYLLAFGGQLQVGANGRARTHNLYFFDPGNVRLTNSTSPSVIAQNQVSRLYFENVAGLRLEDISATDLFLFGVSDVQVRNVRLANSIVAGCATGAGCVSNAIFEDCQTTSSALFSSLQGSNILVTSSRAAWAVDGSFGFSNVTFADNTWSSGVLNTPDSFTSFSAIDSIFADILPAGAVLVDARGLSNGNLTYSLVPANFNPMTQIIDPSGRINQGNGISCFQSALAQRNRCGDPRFATGTLGAYYLGSGSPAIDVGSQTVPSSLANRTTDPVNNAADSGVVDLGWHYPILPP